MIKISDESLVKLLAKHPTQNFEILAKYMSAENLKILIEAYPGMVIRLPSKGKMKQMLMLADVLKTFSGFELNPKRRGKKESREWKKLVRQFKFKYPRLNEKRIIKMLKTGMHFAHDKNGRCLRGIAHKNKEKK